MPWALGVREMTGGLHCPWLCRAGEVMIHSEASLLPTLCGELLSGSCCTVSLEQRISLCSHDLTLSGVQRLAEVKALGIIEDLALVLQGLLSFQRKRKHRPRLALHWCLLGSMGGGDAHPGVRSAFYSFGT